jgi:hypothetical protein
MQGRGTSAGLTEIVFVTNPPAPPFAAASNIAPSFDGGPAAGKIGFENSMPQIVTRRFAISTRLSLLDCCPPFNSSM